MGIWIHSNEVKVKINELWWMKMTNRVFKPLSLDLLTDA